MSATYLSLYVHIVFATRDRAPTIDTSWRNELHAYLGGTIRGLKATPLAVGGVEDHVHILAGMRSNQCVADLVRETKKASSDWATQHWHKFGWQAGYGAFSLSARDRNAVVQYITRQEEHHRTLSSSDELLALLEEFEVEYDKKYFE
jgi:REP element-mobilizing transposase RayT